MNVYPPLLSAKGLPVLFQSSNCAHFFGRYRVESKRDVKMKMYSQKASKISADFGTFWDPF
jgi:hypothetical protein